MKTRGFTLIELMIVIVIIGILAAISIPNLVRMLGHSKEAGVKSNSHTVQLAAEDFAVQNDGVYADDLTSTTLASGQTIVDMLPQSTLLQNPFTGLATEPIDGAAGAPGETGYAAFVDASGTSIGYTITGYGRITTIIQLTSGQ